MKEPWKAVTNISMSLHLLIRSLSPSFKGGLGNDVFWRLPGGIYKERVI